jgi:Icc-related predicted phosphoesterase
MLALLALSLLAGAFETYQLENETACLGKADHAFPAADSWLEAGYRFTVQGGRASVKAEPAKKGAAKLGILAAIKDFSPDTQANLKAFMAAFKKAGATGILVGGDSAYGVDDQDSTLAEVFRFLAGQGLPVYVIIGNSESRSSFNRAALAAFRKHPNLINMNLVRRVDGDGFTLVSLPGYHDRRFIHESSGCQYKTEDAQELARLARGAPAPVVLLTHGPPRQAGKNALDVTSDGANVGDPDLANAIAEAKIPFGVFGHIIEAGARATDLEGKKQIKAGTLAPTLFVNPGPAFSDPMSLNTGAVSRGLAAILTIDGKKAKWESVRAPAAVAAK